MKVKLLKQLRKRAQRNVWIEKWHWMPEPFVIRDIKCCSGYFRASYKELRSAIRDTKMRRREYILDRLHEYGKCSKKYRMDL